MYSKEIAFQEYVLDGQIVYLLTFQYTEATKDHIKQTLSHLRPTYTHRTGEVSQLAGGWKAPLGCWVVARTIWLEFRSALRSYGYSFNYHQPDEAEPHNSGSNSQSNNQRYTREERPVPLNLFIWLGIDPTNELAMRSTYRELVKLLHPDRQSDQSQQQLATQLMAKVNSDFDQLRRKAS